MKKKIAIIGCGISAASMFYFLDEKKFDVSFFDKSRGMGGRMSSRKIENIRFDHGANCFGAVKSDAFKNFISDFLEQGFVCEWQGDFVFYNKKTDEFNSHEAKERLVAKSQSNSLIKELIASKSNKETNLHTKISVVKKSALDDKKWILIDENNKEFDDFDIVISSAPAPQTIDIFPKDFEFLSHLKKVEYFATFALMISFDQKANFKYSHIAVKNSDISRIAYENSKPGRDFDKDCFLIHSSNQFSEDNLESDKEEVAKKLLEEFFKITKIENKAKIESNHRWLYANPKQNYDFDLLFDKKLMIGVIGDYVKGSRVEMAFESGKDMAEFLNKLGE